MYCFLCGNQIGEKEHICPYCKADNLAYRRILYLSDLYYNQGLERAKVRDLSGAIESLQQSLSCNKANTNARNLLGLCYYEIGEAVRGLNEWIIVQNMVPGEAMSQHFLGLVESTPGEMEKINSTIKKYNQAIKYCRSGSRDLAMVQLKKVVSQNPKLVAGHQLLALLQIMDGDYAGAKKSLQNANYIDKNNIITQRYYKELRDILREINAGKKHPRKNLSINDGSEDLNVQEHGIGSFFAGAGYGFSNVIIGAIAGVMVSLFLISPTLQQGQTSEIREALIEANETINSLRSNNAALANESQSLGDRLSAYEGQEDIKTSYSALSRLDKTMAAENPNIAEAMEQFNLINEAMLDEDAKEKYQDLRKQLNPSFAKEYFASGKSFYEVNNYTNAITCFKQCVDIDEKYNDGEAMYLLADSVRLGGNSKQAVSYYKRVQELYPDSVWASTAQQYIDIVVGN